MNVVHYDLFAGIGGFSYALDTVFKEHEIKHIFCEWEAFPTAVLKKHWPDATYYGDIAYLVADTEREGLERSRTKRKGHARQRGGARSNQAQDWTILTGGFPCQPFSQAGRRKGTGDDRYQWPEMFSVIRNVLPDWVVAENVRGLVNWDEGLVLETVCTDLESEGYEVWPFIIPACAVGAPHRRDRVWIVANTTCKRRRKTGTHIKRSQARSTGCSSKPSTDTGRERRGEGASEGVRPEGQEPEQSNCGDSGFGWDTDWREVALATCHDGVDDGLSRRMDGTTISAAKHRKERLKACGNAIVPQVAMEIFKAIKEQETT